MVTLIDFVFVLFQFNNLHNTLARCPHCRKVSSVGASYTKKRAVLYGVAAIIFLILHIIGICLTYGFEKVTAIEFDFH